MEANGAAPVIERIASWRSTAEVLRSVMARREAELTPKQRAVVGEFFVAIDQWSRGQLPLDQAMILTGDGWLRAQVIMNTPIDHPLYEEAMRFFDSIIARGGGFQTNGGWFSQEEIDSQGGRHTQRVDAETGVLNDMIQFPAAIDKNTGRTVWPVQQSSATAERDYESPFREEWF